MEVPSSYAKFHSHRCNASPLRGEKPQNRPLSKLNTGRLALRAMLPVKFTGSIALRHCFVTIFNIITKHLTWTKTINWKFQIPNNKFQMTLQLFPSSERSFPCEGHMHSHSHRNPMGPVGIPVSCLPLYSLAACTRVPTRTSNIFCIRVVVDYRFDIRSECQ